MTVLIIVIHVFDKSIGMKLACRWGGYEYQYNLYYCCYYVIAIVYASALIISNFMFIQRELITKLFKEVCKQNWGINLTSKTKRKITGILLHLVTVIYFDISLICMNRYIPGTRLLSECNYM